MRDGRARKFCFSAPASIARLLPLLPWPGRTRQRLGTSRRRPTQGEEVLACARPTEDDDDFPALHAPCLIPKAAKRAKKKQEEEKARAAWERRNDRVGCKIAAVSFLPGGETGFRLLPAASSRHPTQPRRRKQQQPQRRTQEVEEGWRSGGEVRRPNGGANGGRAPVSAAAAAAATAEGGEPAGPHLHPAASPEARRRGGGEGGGDAGVCRRGRRLREVHGRAHHHPVSEQAQAVREPGRGLFPGRLLPERRGEEGRRGPAAATRVARAGRRRGLPPREPIRRRLGGEGGVRAAAARTVPLRRGGDPVRRRRRRVRAHQALRHQAAVPQGPRRRGQGRRGLREHAPLRARRGAAAPPQDVPDHGPQAGVGAPRQGRRPRPRQGLPRRRAPGRARHGGAPPPWPHPRLARRAPRLRPQPDPLPHGPAPRGEIDPVLLQVDAHLDAGGRVGSRGCRGRRASGRAAAPGRGRQVRLRVLRRHEDVRQFPPAGLQLQLPGRTGVLRAAPVLRGVHGAQGRAGRRLPRRAERPVGRVRQVPARQVPVAGAREDGDGILRAAGAEGHRERRARVPGERVVRRVRGDGAPRVAAALPLLRLRRRRRRGRGVHLPGAHRGQVRGGVHGERQQRADGGRLLCRRRRRGPCRRVHSSAGVQSRPDGDPMPRLRLAAAGSAAVTVVTIAEKPSRFRCPADDGGGEIPFWGGRRVSLAGCRPGLLYHEDHGGGGGLCIY